MKKRERGKRREGKRSKRGNKRGEREEKRKVRKEGKREKRREGTGGSEERKREGKRGEITGKSSFRSVKEKWRQKQKNSTNQQPVNNGTESCS